MTPTTLKRAKTEALAYIDSILRVCYHDCSDSAEEADRHVARFDGIVDDSITMEDFIRDHLLAEYAAAWKEFVSNPDLSHLDEEQKRSSPPVCELPVPYETFAHLIT